jgi:hypothetical protein
VASLAQELDAKAQLLQSRLDYVEAVADLDRATGRTRSNPIGTATIYAA